MSYANRTFTTRPVWNGTRPSLSDLTSADLLALLPGPDARSCRRRIAHNTYVARLGVLT